MKGQLLVSIIIPCYNYADYLPEAIQSARTQTYKNIEIIVINDGSTDNTDEVARKYADNIRYVSRENKGIVATRNEGVSLSRGQYIIQLDADDWLDKNYVQETLATAQRTKSDIVYTQAHIFGRVDFITDYPRFNLEYLKHNNFIHASSLVSKKLFADHQYDNYLGDKGYEDWDLYLDACMDGARAVLAENTLLHYRKHMAVKSRQDLLEGTFKEVLVRHHVLSKQNAKHPDKMWYFSPYIELLKREIEGYVALRDEVASLREQLKLSSEELRRYQEKLEWIKRTPVYKTYKAYRKVSGKRQDRN